MMGKTLLTIAAITLLMGTIALLAGRVVGVDGRERPAPAVGPTLLASAPEAGLIAIAGSVPGRIRVLYARNGGMVFLREISVPGAGEVRELALSADGRDLFIATGVAAYAMSTRTGRVEAQALAGSELRYAARAGRRDG